MYNKSIVCRTLRDFYQNEQGTYVLLTGLMSFVLIGVIALATDGSGLLLDRSRLSQGLEQAGLALIAENNTNRNDADKNTTTGEIKGHTYLNATNKGGNSGKVDHKQRDQELLKGYVNAYLPDAKIKNDFKHECKQEDATDPRSVTCKVEGSVKRVSWLPMKSDLSFAPDVDVSSGPVTVSKTLDDLVPLDLMLVTDLTGSMEEVARGTKTKKITSLRNVVGTISTELLENDNPNVSPYNRIRFASFAFGASQTADTNRCYLPYQLTPNGQKDLLVNTIYSHSGVDTKFSAWLKELGSSNYSIQGQFLKGLIDGIDYSGTVQNIKNFKGTDLAYSISYPKNSWCLGTEASMETTSKKWYGKGQSASLKTAFDKIQPAGATLSSSGMLIGANLLMESNTLKEAQPSELKANTQRILLILSDGRDEIYNKPIKDIPDLTITEKLINAGACTEIRNRLDSLQNQNYAKRPSRIHFVAFGYPPEGSQKNAWLKCVGKDNYHEAGNEEELLKTFRYIANKREEVGRVIPTNY